MSDDGKRDLIRRLLPYMTVLLVVVVGYTAWTFYSRRSATREMEDRARQRQSNPLPPEYLGDKVKILSFTIEPASIRRGQSADLCFSLLNAKSAGFEPSLGPIDLAGQGRVHCESVKPAQTTTYKLTATGASGDTQSASLTLVVR
jgi:hypothetical protein